MQKKSGTQHAVCTLEAAIAQRQSEGENAVFTPPLFTDANRLIINILCSVSYIPIGHTGISVVKIRQNKQNVKFFSDFLFSDCANADS